MELQRLHHRLDDLIASSNQLRSSLSVLSQDFRQLDAQLDDFSRTNLDFSLQLSKESKRKERKIEEEKAEEILMIHSLLTSSM